MRIGFLYGPGAIRTPDQQVMSLPLCLAELRAPTFKEVKIRSFKGFPAGE